MKTTCEYCSVEYRRKKGGGQNKCCSDRCRILCSIDIRGPDDCWPWTGKTRPDGYADFSLGGRRQYAHRVAYILFVGGAPNVLRHSCDNPGCCNPVHLTDGTQHENNLDRHQKGRTKVPYGTGIGAPSLTDEHIRNIRTDERYRAGATIAREYGISKSLVSKIKKRTAWSHVQ